MPRNKSNAPQLVFNFAVAEKRCNRCGVVKPPDKFYRDASPKNPTGRRYSCISCDKARKRTAEVRAQGKKYNESDKGKAAYRRYYDSGKKVAAIDGFRETQTYRQWLEGGGQKRAVAKYGRTEKGRLRNKAKAHRRRAAKRSAPGVFTAANWTRALDYFGRRCAYCGAGGPMDMEHFIPISRGGHHSSGNIVPACERCNGSKHDKMPEEWCNPDAYDRVLTYFRWVAESIKV